MRPAVNTSGAGSQTTAADCADGRAPADDPPPVTPHPNNAKLATLAIAEITNFLRTFSPRYELPTEHAF
jgi:hypothetical protein